MNDNKGFTLLEVIISLSIITFVMFSSYRVYDNSIKVNTKNDRDIKALNLAQSEIEDLRNQIKNLETNTFLEIDEEKVEFAEIPTAISGQKYTKSYMKNYIDDKNNKQREYEVYISINKEEIIDKIYLFDIDISVKLKDDYFSKRQIKLSTSILSNN